MYRYRLHEPRATLGQDWWSYQSSSARSNLIASSHCRSLEITSIPDLNAGGREPVLFQKHGDATRERTYEVRWRLNISGRSTWAVSVPQGKKKHVKNPEQESEVSLIASGPTAARSQLGRASLFLFALYCFLGLIL